MARGQARAMTLRTRAERLLARAIARVPPGPELERKRHWEGRGWDAHTGLWLRRRGDKGPAVSAAQAIAELAAAVQS